MLTQIYLLYKYFYMYAYTYLLKYTKLHIKRYLQFTDNLRILFFFFLLLLFPAKKREKYSFFITSYKPSVLIIRNQICQIRRFIIISIIIILFGCLFVLNSFFPQCLRTSERFVDHYSIHKKMKHTNFFLVRSSFV